MQKLTEAQILKNKTYAQRTGKKLDEMGRIIVRENAWFTIPASIQNKKMEVGETDKQDAWVKNVDAARRIQQHVKAWGATR